MRVLPQVPTYTHRQWVHAQELCRKIPERPSLEGGANIMCKEVNANVHSLMCKCVPGVNWSSLKRRASLITFTEGKHHCQLACKRLPSLCTPMIFFPRGYESVLVLSGLEAFTVKSYRSDVFVASIQPLPFVSGADCANCSSYNVNLTTQDTLLFHLHQSIESKNLEP